MVELHRVDGRTVTALAGLDIDLPVVAMVAMEGNEAVAAWGLAWRDGRCWLWFHMEHPDPSYRWIVIREARNMLKRAAQLGDDAVYTVRDPQFETSQRLLKILGFEPFGEEDGKEVWRTHWPS